MTVAEFASALRSDLHRYNPGHEMPVLTYLAVPGFRYTFWFRSARFLKERQGAFWRALYFLARYRLMRCEHKFGICIPYNTEIGPGLYIGHFGGIVISSQARLGKNCNINHDVTVGTAYGGRHPGTPVIKDGVYIGPGARIIGGVTIGSNVAVGANCVVTESVPDNAIVIGVPGRIISFKGAGAYVINTV